jgi:hypothetical protein
VPDLEIMQVIFKQTGKTITDRYLSTIRQQIKRESFSWYKAMREGDYEYLHEFKERINEIVDLQRQHHEIIMKNQANPSIVQASLAELHKLNITLSNYFDVAPTIVTNPVKQNNTISIPQQETEIIV